MAKRWNNGNMALSATKMSRLRSTHQLRAVEPLEALFSGLRSSLPSDGMADNQPDNQPEVLSSGHRWDGPQTLWRDRWLGPGLFPGATQPTHGFTTLVDSEAHELHVLFVTGDQVATKLEVRLASREGSDAEVDVTLELTASALRAAGNELFDESLPGRMQEQLKRFGEQLRRLDSESLHGTLSTARPSATPRASSDQSCTKRAEHVIELDQRNLVFDLNDVFPLACPVAELDWIDNWFFDLRHSDSGRNEEHCVFVEALSSPLVMADRARTTWYTTLFDPQTRRFEAVLIVGDHILGKFDFAAEDLGGGRARLGWSLSFTGRNDGGNRLVAEPGFRRRTGQMLELLARSIERYLTTGKVYRPSLHQKASFVASRLHTRLRRLGSPAPAARS
ncbi:MAG: hypothetical protein ABI333_16155 [bacterium]